MNDVSDLNSAAALAANRFLQRFAPQQAEAVQPYVEKLFQALQSGNAFVWLNEQEAAMLKRSDELVGTGVGKPLVLMGRRLFLGRVWELEHRLAQDIVRLAQAETDEPKGSETQYYLNEWFQGEESRGQKEAAALALLKELMLITGGPGTGKTTTVAKLLALICLNSAEMPRISLAAPTGKAAAHMARALHRALDSFDMPEHIKQHLLALEGQTVHRLLKLRPPRMQTAFNQQRPLPLDVLVVDEASMLDVSLLLQLLGSIASGCRIIFLGDADQLPSVGIGAVLSAVTQATVLDEQTSERLSIYLPEHSFPVRQNAKPLAQNTAQLTFSHRFGGNSGIGCLARAVIKGDEAEAWQQFDRFPRELRVSDGSLRQKAALLYEKHQDFWHAVDENNIASAFAHAADVVVLTALRQDAAEFNQEYTRYLVRQNRASGKAEWFAGQVVMITQNSYELDLFNGDICLIMPDAANAENSDGISLAAYFPEGETFRKIPISRLPQHETAFAMTVHKSQGSEYQEVWLLPPKTLPNDDSAAEQDEFSSLNRALLYTAITRARKRFAFWGSQKDFNAAVCMQKKRQTALGEMINSIFVKNEAELRI